MKLKDFTPLLVSVIFSVLIALVLNSIIIKQPDLKKDITSVLPINAEFPTLDDSFITDQSIDIFIGVEIGDGEDL